MPSHVGLASVINSKSTFLFILFVSHTPGEADDVPGEEDKDEVKAGGTLDEEEEEERRVRPKVLAALRRARTRLWEGMEREDELERIREKETAKRFGEYFLWDFSNF